MIKIIKLITGEDIISDVIVDEVNNKVLLKKPFRFMMTAEGIGSIPFVPFSKDEEYKISLNHVVAIAEPEDDFLNAYNSQHGSGIVVAKNNMIITE